MNHDETYQTDKSDNLLMLVTGGTNYTMAEEHLLYRKVLRAVVELHTAGNGESARCESCWLGFPCPTIETIEKELG